MFTASFSGLNLVLVSLRFYFPLSSFNRLRPTVLPGQLFVIVSNSIISLTSFRRPFADLVLVNSTCSECPNYKSCLKFMLLEILVFIPSMLVFRPV